MRVARVLSTAALVACLIVPTATHVVAGDAAKAAAKSKKKAQSSPAPARPTGVAKTVDPTDAYYGGSRNDSVTETTNELGQTVYSVAASHFDVSPPLSEMARSSSKAQGGEEAEDDEAPTNPRLPFSRVIRSELPDPVVQAVVEAGDAQSFSGEPVAAPTTGFNFQGLGINGGVPSDCNGAVGNNQFVETVNTRYQVWSLNRGTMTATSVLGPVSINTLWSGFGGACEDQNSGDPVVLFDRTAGGGVNQGRWLISQFTSSGSGGVFYQCVAVSTTKDATGTYNRYAFAIPNGKFGDYPHIAVWSDAYYMMAHGFGGQFVAIFAAMDRAKMILGQNATWVVIQDPNEGGHLPADLDGYTYPPNKAPGIFVSIHSDGMYIYRMKVNFASPFSTTNTLQSIVPVAPSSAACGGGTCIPQPGTGTLLDSLSDRLMYRAAYRNYIDHESLVVTHSVNPSISGVVSGVRWYDFRLSGTPNATCPTYPCIYQQGTIADAANGRSRWMSSIAMDSAENILVGYTTSGKTAGSENHSTRYTGRAKLDPPGAMTVPEATIITGTANNSGNSRWGDYASMVIDPFDDCTFWSTTQYYASTNAWLTRIASAVYPAGTGAGQCQPSTCTSRPATIPLIGTATTPADNQITVTWSGISPTPGAYTVERSVGTCAAEGLYTPVGLTAGAVTTYTDNTVLAGLTYTYRVRASSDTAGKCNALLTSQCVSATATGTCGQKPSFAGAASAASAGASNCGVTVNWAAGTSNCAAAPTLRYNIYRSTDPDFVPSPAYLIATCVVGPSSYLDTNNLLSGTTYYYAVRAEDNTGGNGGACAGGNEESNSVRVFATPYAAGTQGSPGTWTDGGGDGTQLLSRGMTVTTGSPGWRLVKTANDAGANHTPAGAYAYRNAGPSASDTYAPFTCAQLTTPLLTVAGTTVNLKYWERHQVEYHWDGIGVEYSVNGGAFTEVAAPSNSPGAGCDPSDDTSYWELLTCTGNPPGNACGIPDTQRVFSGTLGSGSDCNNFATSATVTPYAHRCHQLAGLNPGDTVQFRWQFSSDEAAEFAGFYLDDVAVTNIRLPNACAPNTCPGQPDGTACVDGNACTTGDFCGGGACVGGSVIPGPAETTGVSAAADKATYSWSSVPSATRYDVVRGSTEALPVGPGGGDEACFSDLPGPSLVDGTIPAAGSGFWYLSRGDNACSAGTFGQQSNGTPRITTTCP